MQICGDIQKMGYEYIYIYAPDIFGHDNDGLIYGVQEVDYFPDYIEFFETLEELETNTNKHKMDVVNRDYFLHRNGYYHLKENGKRM